MNIKCVLDAFNSALTLIVGIPEASLIYFLYVGSLDKSY